jgi:hypothetical protein
MIFFFISVLPVVYCGSGEISPTVKPNSRSWFEAQPSVPISMGGYGEKILRELIMELIFCYDICSTAHKV